MRSPFSYMKGNRQSRPAAEEAPKPRRSIRDAIKDAVGSDAYDKVSSPSTQMSVALSGKQVYAGTVAQAVIARRRAANKRARVARRTHRRAAR